MLPIERIHRIKELILEQHNMKIADLSKELGVSAMTIHRDLKPLIEDGLVTKTFGGITLMQSHVNENSDGQCVYCSRDVHKRLSYRLILSTNVTETACCAHCGLLRQRQINEKVKQSICQDFLRETTISAPLAWYAIDTSVDIGCCQPQVLSFEFKKHADQFVKGFGGKVLSFNKAVEVVYKKMNRKGDQL